MKYYCEVCGKKFDVESNCVACEKAHEITQKEIDEAVAKRKEANKKVYEAYQTYTKLKEDYEREWLPKELKSYNNKYFVDGKETPKVSAHLAKIDMSICMSTYIRMHMHVYEK
jgi:hypothetical protein